MTTFRLPTPPAPIITVTREPRLRFTLVRRSWYEHVTFAFPGYEATPPTSTTRKVLDPAFSLDQVLLNRARRVRDLQARGYAYRNLSAHVCQLWKRLDEDDDYYHFVRLTITSEVC